MICPCGTTKDFSKCCEPLIEGAQAAETAEALMRARYAAYHQRRLDFVESSHDPKTRKATDMEANRAWAESTEWIGLEIIDTKEGGSEDSTGVVEFKAQYKEKDGIKTHHEVSHFTKKSGQWYFTDGKKPHLTFERGTEEKIGRNDPCSCGSGKKFKKCCG